MEINKIYNMDCLEGMKMIEDKSIDMILCDLPYEVTTLEWDNIIPFEPLWEQYERIIKDNGAIVLTASQPFTSSLIMSNPKLFKYELVWFKNVNSNFMLVKKQPLRHHENICVFYKKQPTYNPQMEEGEKYTRKRGLHEKLNSELFVNHFKRKDSSSEKRYPKSVLEFPRDERQIHPTQKPVALFEYLIKTYTNEGELVLDNTIGSGTTAIAAHRTGRNFIGFELNEEYYKLATKRVEDEMAQTTIFDFI